jgi:hypothetical protein
VPHERLPEHEHLLNGGVERHERQGVPEGPVVLHAAPVEHDEHAGGIRERWTPGGATEADAAGRGLDEILVDQVQGRGRRGC